MKIFAVAIVSPTTIVAELKHHRIQHLETLHTDRAIATQVFPARSQLSHVGRDRYITLRQGIRLETEWLAWCQGSIDLLES